MSTSVNVESTLEAIMDSVDHDWRKQDIDDLRAHLEALVKAQSEWYDTSYAAMSRLVQEAHWQMEDMETRRKRLETALQAIIARWEAAKARHGVQVGDPEYIAIARAALTAVAEAKE